jgi:hypothetical protein
MASVTAGLQETIAHGVKATWTATQEAAQAGYDTAKDQVEKRVGVARAGKTMLESGGKSTEVALAAKVASGRVAAQDADLVRRLSAAVAALEDSAAKLGEAASRPQDVHQGVGGVESFGALSQAYEARAKLYRQLLAGLEDLPPVPEMSPVEQDAAVLLQVKDHYETAVQKTTEGAAFLHGKTKEVITSSSANASSALRSRGAVCC